MHVVITNYDTNSLREVKTYNFSYGENTNKRNATAIKNKKNCDKEMKRKASTENLLYFFQRGCLIVQDDHGHLIIFRPQISTLESQKSESKEPKKVLHFEV